MDAIFHNGDSELSVNDPIWEGIHVVCGNCDFGDYPDCLVTNFPELLVAQTHGHLFNINFGFERLDLWAQEEDADICTHGHLHRPAVWKNGKTVLSIQEAFPSRVVRLMNVFMLKYVNADTIFVDYLTRRPRFSYTALSQEIKDDCTRI